MFGVTRKKSKPTTIRRAATSSSDEEEEEDNGRREDRENRRIRSKTKDGKKKRTKKIKTKSSSSAVTLSFDPEDDGEHDKDDELRNAKKSKKRKKGGARSSSARRKTGRHGGGLGYGGMFVDGTGRTSEEEEDAGTSKHQYDEAALTKLRNEQTHNVVRTTNEGEAGAPAPPKAPTTNEGGEAEHAVEGVVPSAAVEVEEEEFIPLSATSDLPAVVLTGDEAMAHAQRHDEEENNHAMEFDHGLTSPPSPPPNCETNASSIQQQQQKQQQQQNQESEEEEDHRQWEDAMARRAGVLPPTAATADEHGERDKAQRTRRKHTNSHPSPSSSLPSLSHIQSSMQPTLSNLQNVRSDLLSDRQRCEANLASTRAECKTHTASLEQCGRALEYYQTLRHDVTTWTGALRETNKLLTRIEDASAKLRTEVAWRHFEKFWEWNVDCTDILERGGLLRTKIPGEAEEGGVPMEEEGEDAREGGVRSVDEFGRDLSSMASMARAQRWSRRRKRCLERRGQRNDDDAAASVLHQSIRVSNKDNMDNSQIMEWTRRREALSQALEILPDLVQEDYLSIANIGALFGDWERTYNEEFARSYARMSLIPMVSVLVRLELCRRWDLLNLLQQSLLSSGIGEVCTNVTEFNWFCDLKNMDLQRKENKEDVVEKKVVKFEEKHAKGILLQVIQTQVASRLLESFSWEEEGSGENGTIKRRGIYDPFSIDQTKCLCSMLKSMLDYFSNCGEEDGQILREETVQKVLKALLSSVKYHVERMVIPIVDASKITIKQNQFAWRDGFSEALNGETSDAIAYSTVILSKELCTLVKNILGQWYPILYQEKKLHSHQQKEEKAITSLVQFVFDDLISARIMPILHSLHDITSSGNSSEKSDNVDKQLSDMPKVIIDDILDSMQVVGLLEKDGWMLMAAPLRVLSKQWEDEKS